MQRFIGTVIALLVIAFAGVAWTQSGIVSADDVVGHVYVNNNTAPANTISGFDRHVDGSLTPIAGSPFQAGGSGSGAPTGSAGALQLSSDGRFVLAVDAGSNQISVLRIQPSGSLTLVDSPVYSEGSTPISLAVNKSLVYVANNGKGASSYAGFSLDASGKLQSLRTAVPGSSYPLPDNAAPGQVLFSGDGTHLIGTRVGPDAGPSYIDSFVVAPNGRLTPAQGSPFPAQRIGPFGSEFRPTDPTQLFVSNAHDGPGAGSVSAYNVTADGTLNPVDGSPFADYQTAACWVEISHDGKYLFAVNTAVPSISRYAISANGSLTLLGSTPFNTPNGLQPFDLRLDPSGSYLYVVDAKAGKISAFRVSGGSLTELSSSPIALSAGATPFGIVVN